MLSPQVIAIIPWILYGLIVLGLFCTIAFFRGVRIVNASANTSDVIRPSEEVVPINRAGRLQLLVACFVFVLLWTCLAWVIVDLFGAISPR